MTCDFDDVVASRATERAIPQLPIAAAWIHRATTEGAPLPELTRLVEADPVLSEDVLRLASSAAYTGAVGQRISLPYAVMRLGRDGLRAVCMTASLCKMATREGPLRSMRIRAWRESLASALASEAVATSRGGDPTTAYVLGLVHDFGKVVSLCVVEDAFADPLAAADEAFFTGLMERHHCDVGWIAAEAWRLPTPIPDVTATHHNPDEHSAYGDIVTLADAAVALATSKRWQLSADEIAALEGVEGADEAMAIRIALAKHPYFLTALGS